MSTTRSEDTIICIDASRSMFRADFETKNGNKTRMMAVLESIERFVRIKHEIDPSDRFGVVVFNGNAKHLSELAFEPEEVTRYIQEALTVDQGSGLGEGLALAVKLIIRELRKIGEKQQRILLLTDGLFHATAVNPIKIAKIASGLGIIIDAVRVGPAKIPGDPIKRIAEITRGTYHYVTGQGELDVVIDRLAKKKEVQVATILDKEDTSVKNLFEDEIADSLLKIEELTPDQAEAELYRPQREGKLKCSICYSSTCPTCKVNFFGCGRFCPSCLKPIHLHCAINWAKQQNKDKKNKSDVRVFRCPHCFYLLKIPVPKANVLSEEDDEYGSISEKVEVRLVMFDEEGPQIYNEVCGVCSSLFDGDEDVQLYKCDCGAYFHADCFREAMGVERRCPSCRKRVEVEDL